MSEISSRTLVLPNRNALGLGAVLLAMWYTGAGQTNGAAYLLCFTLAGLAMVSLPHAWANVRGLRLRPGAIAPVFAGDPLSIPIVAESAPGRSHLRVSAEIVKSGEATFLETISGSQSIRATLTAPEARRGRYEQIEARLSSIYPLGFFTGATSFTLRQTFYVYPRPEGSLALPAPTEPGRESSGGILGEGDDFAGAREWRAGESMRHVDWKAAARGGRLLVKQWSGAVSDIVTLDWNALPDLAVEARLSQLARWVLTAEQTGATYGLTLPGWSLPPSRGDSHLHACLRGLASFDAPAAAGREGRA